MRPSQRHAHSAVPSYLVVLGLATALAPGALAAQCADGAPPPCVERRTAVAPPPAPRLDERTWLVLPFENTTRAAEAQLVSQASVTLLNQEIGRWQDVRSIPDDRVADLLRQMPEAQRGSLGLEGALGLARRAGAGRLLVGNFLSVGGRANLTARLYDTRSGRLLKTAPERLSGFTSDAGLDSLTSTFSRLALSLLEVPPKTAANADLGTTSVEAYRLYVQGITSLNRLRWDSASVTLEKATVLDSTFAIAHLRAAQAYAALGIAPDFNRHLDAATRFSSRLQARQRLLLPTIGPGRANPGRACEAAAALLAADSTDVDGWIAAGDCARNARIDTAGGQVRFRGNVNVALRAYERALSLDPSNAFAFTRAFSQYIGGAWNGCAMATLSCPRRAFFLGRRTVVADTLVDTPVLYGSNPFVGANVMLVDSATTEILIRRAVVLARRFSLANPTQWIGHATLGRALLYAGDLDGAERELKASGEAASVPGDRRLYYRDRIALAVARLRPAEARTLLDSMFLDRRATSQPQFASMLGVLSKDLPVDEESSPDVRATRATFNLLYVGVLPPEGVGVVERFAAASEARSAIGADYRAAAIELGRTISFWMTRQRPASDTALQDPVRRFQGWFALGDTARARRDLTLGADRLRSQSPFAMDGDELFVSEGLLLMGDSTAALAQLRRVAAKWPRLPFAGDGTMGGTVMRASFPGQSSSIRVAGRLWLLYADLAYALKANDDARNAYRMVVGLWGGGEAPVQPMVARARARLAALGG
jgi:tetratricopeptide (TPR) repeat protein